MRIALVSDVVYPYVRGGAERRFFEIGRRLATRGHEVHLYCMQYWEGASERVENGVTLHGVCKAPALYVGGRRSITQPLTYALALRKALRNEPFDIIDASNFPYYSLFSVRTAASRANKPFVATWHEVWGKERWLSYAGSIVGRVGWYIERRTAKLPDRFIAVSSLTAARLSNVLGASQPITIIENGIDLDAIDSATPAKIGADIVFLGRLIPEKGVDTLLRAFALLGTVEAGMQSPIMGAAKTTNAPAKRVQKKTTRTRGSRVAPKKVGTKTPTHHAPHLRIIGEGPDRTRLEALATELGVASRVTFTGKIEKDTDVYSMLKAARVFALPSTREGFGIAVIEANACGLPVVTVDHPDNAAVEIIRTHQTGTICSNTPEALAEALRAQLEKPIAADKCQAAAAAYDWDAITERVLEVYQR